MTRVRPMAAVVTTLTTTLATTLAAAVLATTAQSAQAGPAPEHQAPRATVVTAGITHLHLHVTGCDTCRITLQHAVTDNPKVWSSKAKPIGSDQRVSWTVRSAKTHGMSFVLSAPWAGSTGSVPNLVTRYQGAAIDSAVSQAQARAARRAEGCWAGTSIDDVTLDFRVAHIEAQDLGGQPTTIPLAWAPHTMSSWKPASKTYRGTIGNQDAFYCTKPPTTKVTLTAAGCEGCHVSLVTGARRVENTWESADKVVSDGSVSFTVPRALTRGLTTVVIAPRENTPHPTGYLTTVVWRYAGHDPGTAVSFTDARAQSLGSACWAGTRRAAVTVDLTVRKVRVLGNGGMTNGSIAFTSLTQGSLPPMREVQKGIYGTQEVTVCHK